MFFRRERPKAPTFEEQLEALRNAGFHVEPAAGRFRVSRDGCAALLDNVDGQPALAERPGIVMGGEIGRLVDGGFQKFFQTPSGRRKPALAVELKSLHDFEEDLKEALGLKSLYNESLGTVSTFYLYDRVEGRDSGANARIWNH